MRIRGDVYWQWADPTLHHREHDETLDDDMFLDVQVSWRERARRRCSSASMRLLALRFTKRLSTPAQASR